MAATCFLASPIFTGIKPIHLWNAPAADDPFCFNKVFKNLQLFVKKQLKGDDQSDRHDVSVGLTNTPLWLWWLILTLGLAALMEAIYCQMVEERRGPGREGRGILHLQIHTRGTQAGTGRVGMHILVLHPTSCPWQAQESSSAPLPLGKESIHGLIPTHNKSPLFSQLI